MKVMAMLLCVVTMATLSACSKEDDYQKKIIGSWESVRTYGTNQQGESVNEQCEGEEVWTFKSNGTCIIYIDEFGESQYYSYSIVDNNKLQIMMLFAVQYEIHELTNSKMVLHMELMGADAYIEFRKIS